MAKVTGTCHISSAQMSVLAIIEQVLTTTTLEVPVT